MLIPGILGLPVLVLAIVIGWAFMSEQLLKDIDAERAAAARHWYAE
jgi:hypothetical protein